MKIVFYIDTNTPLINVNKAYLLFAKYTAENSNYETYYINNYFVEDSNIYENSPLIFLEQNKCDFSKFEKNTTFVCPLNYLAHLLSKCSNIPLAKICLYNYNRSSIDWLVSHIGDSTVKPSLIDLFIKTNSLIYLDDTCILDKNNTNFYKNNIFLPTINDIDEIEYEEKRPIIDVNTYNIAYYADLHSINQFTIENLFKNLSAFYNEKNIALHLVGHVKSICNCDFKTCTIGESKVIYTGKISDSEAYQYLKDNADFVLAVGADAIKVSSWGLPVIIPVNNSSSFSGDRYVNIFDVKNSIYNWNNLDLLNFNNDCYTIEHIIEDIYNHNKKQELAETCYNYYINNFSHMAIAQKIIDSTDKTELTVFDCLSIPKIKNKLSIYHSSTNDSISFSTFLERSNAKSVNEPVETPKKKPIVKGIKQLIKKVVPNQILYRKFYKINASYKHKVRYIANMAKTKKIKVAFVVVFDDVFPSRPIFENMLKDEHFEPYIVVVPDVLMSYEDKIKTYNKTLTTLKDAYPNNIKEGYNIDKDLYIDLKDEYPIMFFCNPYKHLVHPYHEIEHYLDKNILPIYVSYGFAALKFWEEVIKTDFYNYTWKTTLETKSNLAHLKTIEKIKGKNAIVTGYIKMDNMAKIKEMPRDRKRILICPHHTVWGWENLNISNFLKYAEFFVELPKLYPQIDFVFRPHPLLLTNLKEHNVWTQEQIDDYMDRLLASPNIVYDNSGDYFDKFVNSDAMIHDCGSFIGEYLYTKKPCCYMMKSKEITYEGLVPLGQQCMDQYYHAFEKEDIIKFIDDVVLNGNDPLKTSREKFVDSELMTNYPHAAENVINMIKTELKIK